MEKINILFDKNNVIVRPTTDKEMKVAFEVCYSAIDIPENVIGYIVENEDEWYLGIGNDRGTFNQYSLYRIAKKYSSSDDLVKQLSYLMTCFISGMRISINDK